MNWGQSKNLILSSAAAALLAVAVPGAAQASVATSGCGGGTSCTLQQLFDGGSISIANFTFDNWSLEQNDGSGVTPTDVTVTGVDVMPPGGDPATIGLIFEFSPALTTGSFVEFDFDWDASASGSGVFTDIALDLITFSTPGDSFVEVGSNFSNGGAGSVRVGDPNPGTSDSEAQASITGFSQDTDIQMEADMGNPSLTRFDFTYTVEGVQSNMPPVDMPEPASFAMLAFGLAFLGAMTRRRSGVRADPTT